jgi:hypothetical protein
MEKYRERLSGKTLNEIRASHGYPRISSFIIISDLERELYDKVRTELNTYLTGLHEIKEALEFRRKRH